MSADATQFLTAAPAVKRDWQGRYRIPDPVTGDEKSWTRATTVAKTLDDTFKLQQREGRLVAHGIGKRRDLYALAASTPLDDWKALNDLAKQAREAAEADSKANLGTALHRFTERLDLGETLEQINPPEPWDADCRAYVDTLAAHGVRIERDGIERVVTMHDVDIAGTGDRLRCWLPGRRLPLIGDLKTGGYLAWGSWAVQLATYAYADSVYNTATGLHEPMPDVDKTRALVIHLPVGAGRCDLYLIDIESGYEALQHSLWARKWRSRKDLHEPLTVASSVLAPADVPAEFRQVMEAAKTDLPVFKLGPVLVETPERHADRMCVAGVESYDALKDRVRSIIDAGHGTALAACWPDGVPTFKQGGHTVDQLAAIGRLCADVERDHGLAFPQPAATTEFVAPDDPRVVDLVDRIQALPSDLSAQLAADALANQCPKLTSGRATPADVELVAEALNDTELVEGERYRVVVDLIGDLAPDEAEALIDEVQAGHPNVDQLTGESVERLRVLVEAIDRCVVAFTYENDRPVVMTTEQADAYIVERHGGRKAAIAAGSTAATQLGKTKPRSMPQVLADPLIAAHVATLDFETRHTDSVPQSPKGIS